jgi:hypothetical protein
MRKLALVVAAAITIACGGDNGSPTSPSRTTSTTPPPLPRADLRLSGQAQWAFCLSVLGTCALQASIQNMGPGCATQTSVVARFYDRNDQQLGDAQMGASGGLAAKTIRPGEIVQILSLSQVPAQVVSNTASYRLFPTWNDVRCP